MEIIKIKIINSITKTITITIMVIENIVKIIIKIEIIMIIITIIIININIKRKIPIRKKIINKKKRKKYHRKTVTQIRFTLVKKINQLMKIKTIKSIKDKVPWKKIIRIICIDFLKIFSQIKQPNNNNFMRCINNKLNL